MWCGLKTLFELIVEETLIFNLKLLKTCLGLLTPFVKNLLWRKQGVQVTMFHVSKF